MVASDRIKGRNIVEVHDNVGAAETELVQLNGYYLLVGSVGVKVGSSGFVHLLPPIVLGVTFRSIVRFLQNRGRVLRNFLCIQAFHAVFSTIGT